MQWIDRNGRGLRASDAWKGGARVEAAPHNPEAHVITNVGRFAQCRRDRFCRCRRCKPPLAPRHGY